MDFVKSFFPRGFPKNDGRLVACHDVFELRVQVLGHVPVAVGEPEGMAPLVERVVDAHLEPALAARLVQFAQQVAFRADVHGVPALAVGARPETEPVVIVGRRDDVLRAGPHEEVRPEIGVPHLGGETLGELLIPEILAIDAFVELLGGRALAAHLVAVPLGVAAVFPRRNRVRSPDDEDAEAGLLEPFRNRAFVEGLPVRFVSNALGCARGGGRRDQTGDKKGPDRIRYACAASLHLSLPFGHCCPLTAYRGQVTSEGRTA